MGIEREGRNKWKRLEMGRSIGSHERGGSREQG